MASRSTLVRRSISSGFTGVSWEIVSAVLGAVIASQLLGALAFPDKRVDPTELDKNMSTLEERIDTHAGQRVDDLRPGLRTMAVQLAYLTKEEWKAERGFVGEPTPDDFAQDPPIVQVVDENGNVTSEPAPTGVAFFPEFEAPEGEATVGDSSTERPWFNWLEIAVLAGALVLVFAARAATRYRHLKREQSLWPTGSHFGSLHDVAAAVQAAAESVGETPPAVAVDPVGRRVLTHAVDVDPSRLREVIGEVLGFAQLLEPFAFRLRDASGEHLCDVLIVQTAPEFDASVGGV